MAAPASAYRIGTLPINMGAVVLGDVLWALVQSGVSDTVIKERFYLDGFFSIGDGAAGNVTVNSGFAGFCYVGSENYYMHNLARISYVSGWYEGREIVIFNDAGLNTLGIAIINSTSLRWANYVRNSFTFKSAYYINSDWTGIRYRVVPSPWIEQSFDQTIPQQQSVTQSLDFNPAANKGQVLEMQAILQNAEGIYYSPTASTILESEIFEFDVFKRVSQCDSSTQMQVSVWMTRDLIDQFPSIPENTASTTGLIMYKNVEQTIKADQGWYFGFDDAKSYEVDATGQLTRYVVCTETRGIIYLNVDMTVDVDLNEVYSAVVAFIDIPWTSSNIVITGRIDTHPTIPTANGKDFSLAIPAGGSTGEMNNFDLIALPGETYYWQNSISVPAGFIIEKQPL